MITEKGKKLYTHIKRQTDLHAKLNVGIWKNIDELINMIQIRNTGNKIHKNQKIKELKEYLEIFHKEMQK